ncbi:MAG: exosortase [Armatimonadetes bacterium]|nr:exosortase [Armatimonadota bacterium]
MRDAPVCSDALTPTLSRGERGPERRCPAVSCHASVITLGLCLWLAGCGRLGPAFTPDLPATLQALYAAARSSPGAEALAAVGDAEAARRNWLAAVDAYQQVLRKVSHHRGALTRLADIRIAHGDRDEALRLVQELDRGYANDAAAQAELGDLYGRLDLPDMAAASYRRALTLDPRQRLALLRLGAAALDARRLDEGRQFAARLDAAAAGSAEARSLRLLLARATGDSAGMERWLRDAWRAEPSTATLTALSNLLFAQHRNDEVVKLSDPWLAAHPDDVPIAVNRALSLARTADTRAGRQALARLAERHPADPQVHFAYGRVLFDQGLTDQAAAALDQAWRLAPIDTRLRMAIADLFAGHEQVRHADELYVQLAREDPRYLPELAERRGVLLQRAGATPDQGPDPTEQSYLIALRSHPSNVRVLNNLAFLYAEGRRDLKTARALIERALAARPSDANLQDTLAWVLIRQGENLRPPGARAADRSQAAGRHAGRGLPRPDRLRGTGPAAGGQAVIPAAATLALAALFAYHASLGWIVAGWRQNPYYSHGPLVPLLAAWLLWRSRGAIRAAERRTWWPGLAVAAVAALCYAVGHLRDINVAVAASLYLMLHAAVLTIAGPRVYRAAWFPLAFLAFAVPVPQLLIYDYSFPLQLVSARLAPLLPSLPTGASAFATGERMWLDGQEYVVGVQCSGFKAVLGLVMVGLLVAWLTDTDRRRKVVIALLAAPLAVLANVVRLFLILVVGRLWGHDFAVGRFHDVSGFLMLFVAVGLLLGAARLVVGREADLAGAPAPAGEPARGGLAWQPVAALAGLLVALGVVGLATAPPELAVPEVSFAGVPLKLGAWRGEDVPADPRVKAELGDVALLQRVYQQPGQPDMQVIVICGRGRRSLHTPQACYRGAGSEILGKDDVTLELSGRALPFRELVVGRHGRPELLAVYTFTNGERTTPEFGEQQRESLRNTTTIWTQIHFAVPWCGTSQASLEALKPFARELWPEVERALPYNAPTPAR